MYQTLHASVRCIDFMHVSAVAHAQVALIKQAGEAAASMVNDLPALSEVCTAWLAMPEDQPASTGEAGHSPRMGNGPQTEAAATASRMHERQKAHAELVYTRFMHKLRGTRYAAKGEEETAQMDSVSAVAKGGIVDGPPGGEDGVGKALLVTEQVEVLIQEATSLDNLAQMYEGWSAWI